MVCEKRAILTLSFNQGIIVAFVIAFISDGTPGKENITIPLILNLNPRADPIELSITSHFEALKLGSI